MNVNYEYYKFFYYTAKYKSLSAAAVHMDSNQPNVSRVIKILESEIGRPLFIRSRRGMELTVEGEHLYNRIKGAIEQIIMTEDELDEKKAYLQHNIHFAISGSAMHFLLPIIEEYRDNNPDDKLHINCHLTHEAIEAVINEQVDFALVISDGINNPKVKATEILNIENVLIGGPAYKSLAASPISIKDLAKYPMVTLAENTSSYDFYSEMFERNGVRYKSDIVAETTDQVLLCIIYNLGLGFIPDISFRECIKTTELYKIETVEKLPVRKLYLIQNEAHRSSECANNLIEFLISHKE